ncbi:hypothetical protein [Actinoplanes sp. NPDC049118]|uniref:hypothetical protein n=1 Tax=Actinoplanes sp. NPDC049118 TaxID=3155769 RepID=UPI0033ED2698
MRSRTERRRALAVPVVAMALAGSMVAPSAPAGAAPAPENALESDWLGLGYNQDPQYSGGGAWAADPWNQMTERASFINPGLVRIMVNRPWFNDPANPGTYTWDSVEMRNLYKVLNFYRQRGTGVVTGMWGLNDRDYYVSTPAAELQADLVKHLVKTKGFTNVVRYNGINEPNVGDDDDSTAPIRYADWVTATDNLRVEFDERHLDAGLIGGPDTAEAGISALDGDLGLESVQGRAAEKEQSLVWHLDKLAGFSVRFYVQPLPPSDAVKWTFQTSSDGQTGWTDVKVRATDPAETIGDKPWYRIDVSPEQALTNANYLRLTMPALAGTERAVSSVTLRPRSGDPFTDEMNDTGKTVASTRGWTHPKGNEANDWWLQSALDGPLVAQHEVHFYDHEVDLESPYDYPERALSEAVRQVRAANNNASVILGETGMKAPGNDDDKDYSFNLTYDHGVRMADLAVQEARSGLDGAMAWCLDGYARKNPCGMWDRWQNPKDATLRPWFYTWSLLCRSLPAGSKMYAPEQPDDVRVLKAKLPAAAGGGWTFVLVNRGSSAATVPITAQTGTITLAKYVYSENNAPVDPRTQFPVPAGSLTTSFDSGHNLTVGPNSVVVFTNVVVR